MKKSRCVWKCVLKIREKEKARQRQRSISTNTCPSRDCTHTHTHTCRKLYQTLSFSHTNAFFTLVTPHPYIKPIWLPISLSVKSTLLSPFQRQKKKRFYLCNIFAFIYPHYYYWRPSEVCIMDDCYHRQSCYVSSPLIHGLRCWCNGSMVVCSISLMWWRVTQNPGPLPSICFYMRHNLRTNPSLCLGCSNSEQFLSCFQERLLHMRATSLVHLFNTIYGYTENWKSVASAWYSNT